MNPMMKTRTLEVTVISGDNLCMDQNLVTENVYVVVRAESLKCWTTKMGKQGGESLGLGQSSLWNERLKVEAPLHAKSITFEVQCKTSKGSVRSIGLARIAISDVIPKEEGCSSEVLSYRLRNWEGRRSGVINFSVKVANKEEQETEKQKGSKMVTSKDFTPEIIGVHRHHQHMNAGGNNNNNEEEEEEEEEEEYVMGIPVWWNQAGIRV